MLEDRSEAKRRCVKCRPGEPVHPENLESINRGTPYLVGYCDTDADAASSVPIEKHSG